MTFLRTAGEFTCLSRQLGPACEAVAGWARALAADHRGIPRKFRAGDRRPLLASLIADASAGKRRPLRGGVRAKRFPAPAPAACVIADGGAFNLYGLFCQEVRGVYALCKASAPKPVAWKATSAQAVDFDLDNVVRYTDAQQRARDGTATRCCSHALVEGARK